MFPKTSKRKAFWMCLVCALIAWGGWQIGNATPGYTGHLICAGPFIFFTALYLVAFLLKSGRDQKLASEPDEAPQVSNQAYQPRSRYYIPQDDK